jgi:hypothetical protein
VAHLLDQKGFRLGIQERADGAWHVEAVSCDPKCRSYWPDPTLTYTLDTLLRQYNLKSQNFAWSPCRSCASSMYAQAGAVWQYREPEEVGCALLAWRFMKVHVGFVRYCSFHEREAVAPAMATLP